MLFTPIKLIMVVAFAFSFSAFAEGAEGGGEAAKPGAAPEKKERSQSAEYVEKTTKMNAMQSRIDDAQKDFDGLVEEKEKEKDQKKKDEIIKQLVEISKKRNKDVEDFNRTKQELLYQYPAKTAELNHMYQTEEKKDVDEMQGTADIDDLLTRIKKVIQKKFAPFDPENDKPKPSTKDAKAANGKSGGPDGDAPAKLRLEK